MSQLTHRMQFKRKYQHSSARIEGARKLSIRPREAPAFVISAIAVIAQSASNDPLEYMQASASALWIFNHNLGRNPTVTVYTLGGAEIFAEVLHMSVNQVRIIFDAPQSGYAIAI